MNRVNLLLALMAGVGFGAAGVSVFLNPSQMQTSAWLPWEIAMKSGMEPRQFNNVGRLMAPLRRRHRAHGNKFKPRSIVVQPKA